MFFLTIILVLALLYISVIGADADKAVGSFKYALISLMYAPLRYGVIAVAAVSACVWVYYINDEVSRQLTSAQKLVDAYKPAFDISSSPDILGIMVAHNYLKEPIPLLPDQYNNVVLSDTERLSNLRDLYRKCFKALPRALRDYPDVKDNPLSLQKHSQLWLVRTGSGPYSVLFISHDTKLKDGETLVSHVNNVRAEEFNQEKSQTTTLITLSAC